MLKVDSKCPKFWTNEWISETKCLKFAVISEENRLLQLKNRRSALRKW